MVLCDMDGEPVFSADDVHLLGTKSGDVLDRIYSVVLDQMENPVEPDMPPTITGAGFPSDDELAKQVMAVSEFAQQQRAKEQASE